MLELKSSMKKMYIISFIGNYNWKCLNHETLLKFFIGLWVQFSGTFNSRDEWWLDWEIFFIKNFGSTPFFGHWLDVNTLVDMLVYSWDLKI